MNKARHILPQIPIFTPLGEFTLGKKAIPHSKPVMLPPPWPATSTELGILTVIAKLRKIMITMMATCMHLICWRAWLLSKALQFTKIIANKPVNIPKSAVDAPIDLPSGTHRAENRFPPMLHKKNKDIDWILTRLQYTLPSYAWSQPSLLTSFQI